MSPQSQIQTLLFPLGIVMTVIWVAAIALTDEMTQPSLLPVKLPSAFPSGASVASLPQQGLQQLVGQLQFFPVRLLQAS